MGVNKSSLHFVNFQLQISVNHCSSLPYQLFAQKKIRGMGEWRKPVRVVSEGTICCGSQCWQCDKG